MPRKSVTIREDQARFVDDRHINFSSWGAEQIEEWYEEGEEFPSSREKRSAPMTRKSVPVSEKIDEFLYEERVNLSHFLQDRLDDRMERERKLDELGE